MDNLSKATRIADVLYVVSCGATVSVDFAENSPQGGGVRDAVAEGYLVPDGEGLLQLSETGKQASFGKDPWGYIYNTLNIRELAQTLGRDGEFLSFDFLEGCADEIGQRQTGEIKKR